MIAAIAVTLVVVAIFVAPSVIAEVSRRRRRPPQDLRAEAQSDWWPQFERDFRAYARRRARGRRPARGRLHAPAGHRTRSGWGGWGGRGRVHARVPVRWRSGR